MPVQHVGFDATEMHQAVGPRCVNVLCCVTSLLHCCATNTTVIDRISSGLTNVRLERRSSKIGRFNWSEINF